MISAPAQRSGSVNTILPTYRALLQVNWLRREGKS
jgi:hypothetical protein